MLAFSLAAEAQNPAIADPRALQQAGFEDYRQPVGRLQDGALGIDLEARVAAWRPWGRRGRRCAPMPSRPTGLLPAHLAR